MISYVWYCSTMTSYYEIIVWRNDITIYNIIVLRYHIVRHGMGQTMITCYTVNINNNVTTNMTKTVTYDLHLEYINPTGGALVVWPGIRPVQSW